MRTCLKIAKVLLYTIVLASSCAMGAGIAYLYTEVSDWFLFLILAAIIIAMSLLFGARVIIDDYINPYLHQ